MCRICGDCAKEHNRSIDDSVDESESSPTKSDIAQLRDLFLGQ